MTPPPILWQNLPAKVLLKDEAIQGQWDALNAQRSNLPILASYAVAAALRTFGRGDERLLIGRQGDSDAAMFVLQRGGPGQWLTFQPSQLPLGAWVAAAGLSLPELASQLIRGPLGTALVLSITQVDPLFAPRGDDGPAWSFGDYIETGWIDIKGDLQDYWAQRGKNLRSNLRKQRTKLAADAVDTRMQTSTRAETMAGAVGRYGAMESAGWKAQDGTAIHPDNAQGSFYRELLEQAAARGEARVYEYSFGDRVVAANLCLQRNGTLVVLKTTYDEGIDKSVSPANLLRQDEMEHFFTSGQFHRIEYYGRFLDWHGRWTENKRALYHLTVYRWPWLKMMRSLRQGSAVRKTGAMA